MILAILISSLAAILWLMGLGILFAKSIKPSTFRCSHKDGAIVVFFSSFARAVYIKTSVMNSGSEIIIARFCLGFLILFFVSFIIAINEVIQYHA
jgi:hypothetical protein